MFASLIEQKQPKALYLILAIEILTSIGHFGIRILLLFYLLNQLHFEYEEAFAIFALYMGFTEGLGIITGRISDKFLGIYQSIYLGGLLIIFGYISISFVTKESLYIGLSAAAAGRAMFETSIAALLGECYGKDDLRRDAGFTYFYVSLNVGGFLSIATGSYIASAYGWEYLFWV